MEALSGAGRLDHPNEFTAESPMQHIVDCCTDDSSSGQRRLALLRLLSESLQTVMERALPRTEVAALECSDQELKLCTGFLGAFEVLPALCEPMEFEDDEDDGTVARLQAAAAFVSVLPTISLALCRRGAFGPSAPTATAGCIRQRILDCLDVVVPCLQLGCEAGAVTADTAASAITSTAVLLLRECVNAPPNQHYSSTACCSDCASVESLVPVHGLVPSCLHAALAALWASTQQQLTSLAGCGHSSLATRSLAELAEAAVALLLETAAPQPAAAALFTGGAAADAAPHSCPSRALFEAFAQPACRSLAGSLAATAAAIAQAAAAQDHCDSMPGVLVAGSALQSVARLLLLLPHACQPAAVTALVVAPATGSGVEELDSAVVVSIVGSAANGTSLAHGVDDAFDAGLLLDSRELRLLRAGALSLWDSALAASLSPYHPRHLGSASPYPFPALSGVLRAAVASSMASCAIAAAAIASDHSGACRVPDTLRMGADAHADHHADEFRDRVLRRVVEALQQPPPHPAGSALSEAPSHHSHQHTASQADAVRCALVRDACGHLLAMLASSVAGTVCTRGGSVEPCPGGPACTLRVQRQEIASLVSTVELALFAGPGLLPVGGGTYDEGSGDGNSLASPLQLRAAAAFLPALATAADSLSRMNRLAAACCSQTACCSSRIAAEPSCSSSGGSNGKEGPSCPPAVDCEDNDALARYLAVSCRRMWSRLLLATAGCALLPLFDDTRPPAGIAASPEPPPTAAHVLPPSTAGHTVEPGSISNTADAVVDIEDGFRSATVDSAADAVDDIEDDVIIHALQASLSSSSSSSFAAPRLSSRSSSSIAAAAASAVGFSPELTLQGKPRDASRAGPRDSGTGPRDFGTGPRDSGTGPDVRVAAAAPSSSVSGSPPASASSHYGSAEHPSPATAAKRSITAPVSSHPRGSPSSPSASPVAAAPEPFDALDPYAVSVGLSTLLASLPLLLRLLPDGPSGGGDSCTTNTPRPCYEPALPPAPASEGAESCTAHPHGAAACAAGVPFAAAGPVLSVRSLCRASLLLGLSCHDDSPAFRVILGGTHSTAEDLRVSALESLPACVRALTAAQQTLPQVYGGSPAAGSRRQSRAPQVLASAGGPAPYFDGCRGCGAAAPPCRWAAVLPLLQDAAWACGLGVSARGDASPLPPPPGTPLSGENGAGVGGHATGASGGSPPPPAHPSAAASGTAAGSSVESTPLLAYDDPVAGDAPAPSPVLLPGFNALGVIHAACRGGPGAERGADGGCGCSQQGGAGPSLGQQCECSCCGCPGGGPISGRESAPSCVPSAGPLPDGPLNDFVAACDDTAGATDAADATDIATAPPPFAGSGRATVPWGNEEGTLLSSAKAVTDADTFAAPASIGGAALALPLLPTLQRAPSMESIGSSLPLSPTTVPPPAVVAADTSGWRPREALARAVPMVLHSLFSAAVPPQPQPLHSTPLPLTDERDGRSPHRCSDGPVAQCACSHGPSCPVFPAHLGATPRCPLRGCCSGTPRIAVLSLLADVAGGLLADPVSCVREAAVAAVGAVVAAASALESSSPPASAARDRAKEIGAVLSSRAVGLAAGAGGGTSVQSRALFTLFCAAAETAQQQQPPAPAAADSPAPGAYPAACAGAPAPPDPLRLFACSAPTHAERAAAAALAVRLASGGPGIGAVPNGPASGGGPEGSPPRLPPHLSSPLLAACVPPRGCADYSDAYWRHREGVVAAAAGAAAGAGGGALTSPLVPTLLAMHSAGGTPLPLPAVAPRDESAPVLPWPPALRIALRSAALAVLATPAWGLCALPPRPPAARGTPSPGAAALPRRLARRIRGAGGAPSPLRHQASSADGPVGGPPAPAPSSLSSSSSVGSSHGPASPAPPAPGSPAAPPAPGDDGRRSREWRALAAVMGVPAPAASSTPRSRPLLLLPQQGPSVSSSSSSGRSEEEQGEGGRVEGPHPAPGPRGTSFRRDGAVSSPPPSGGAADLVAAWAGAGAFPPGSRPAAARFLLEEEEEEGPEDGGSEDEEEEGSMGRGSLAINALPSLPRSAGGGARKPASRGTMPSLRTPAAAVAGESRGAGESGQASSLAAIVVGGDEEDEEEEEVTFTMAGGPCPEGSAPLAFVSSASASSPHASLHDDPEQRGDVWSDGGDLDCPTPRNTRCGGEEGAHQHPAADAAALPRKEGAVGGAPASAPRPSPVAPIQAGSSSPLAQSTLSPISPVGMDPVPAAGSGSRAQGGQGGELRVRVSISPGSGSPALPKRQYTDSSDSGGGHRGAGEDAGGGAPRPSGAPRPASGPPSAHGSARMSALGSASSAVSSASSGGSSGSGFGGGRTGRGLELLMAHSDTPRGSWTLGAADRGGRGTWASRAASGVGGSGGTPPSAGQWGSPAFGSGSTGSAGRIGAPGIGADRALLQAGAVVAEPGAGTGAGPPPPLGMRGDPGVRGAAPPPLDTGSPTSPSAAQVAFASPTGQLRQSSGPHPSGSPTGEGGGPDPRGAAPSGVINGPSASPPPPPLTRDSWAGATGSWGGAAGLLSPRAGSNAQPAAPAAPVPLPGPLSSPWVQLPRIDTPLPSQLTLASRASRAGPPAPAEAAEGAAHLIAPEAAAAAAAVVDDASLAPSGAAPFSRPQDDCARPSIGGTAPSARSPSDLRSRRVLSHADLFPSPSPGTPHEEGLEGQRSRSAEFNEEEGGEGEGDDGEASHYSSAHELSQSAALLLPDLRPRAPSPASSGDQQVGGRGVGPRGAAGAVAAPRAPAAIDTSTPRAPTGSAAGSKHQGLAFAVDAASPPGAGAGMTRQSSAPAELGAHFTPEFGTPSRHPPPHAFPMRGLGSPIGSPSGAPVSANAAGGCCEGEEGGAAPSPGACPAHPRPVQRAQVPPPQQPRHQQPYGGLLAPGGTLPPSPAGLRVGTHHHPLHLPPLCPAPSSLASARTPGAGATARSLTPGPGEAAPPALTPASPSLPGRASPTPPIPHGGAGPSPPAAPAVTGGAGGGPGGHRHRRSVPLSLVAGDALSLSLSQLDLGEEGEGGGRHTFELGELELGEEDEHSSGIRFIIPAPPSALENGRRQDGRRQDPDEDDDACWGGGGGSGAAAESATPKPQLLTHGFELFHTEADVAASRLKALAAAAAGGSVGGRGSGGHSEGFGSSSGGPGSSIARLSAGGLASSGGTVIGGSTRRVRIAPPPTDAGPAFMRRGGSQPNLNGFR